MKVVVQRNFGPTDAFDVWFVLDDELKGKRQVGRFTPQEFGPARIEWQDHEPYTDVEPTLRLGGYELEMFRRGLDEYGPTTTGNEAFTRDVVKTRDRLLTLVEHLAGGDR